MRTVAPYPVDALGLAVAVVALLPELGPLAAAALGNQLTVDVEYRAHAERTHIDHTVPPWIALDCTVSMRTMAGIWSAQP